MMKTINLQGSSLQKAQLTCTLQNCQCQEGQAEKLTRLKENKKAWQWIETCNCGLDLDQGEIFYYKKNYWTVSKFQYGLYHIYRHTHIYAYIHVYIHIYMREDAMQMQQNINNWSILVKDRWVLIILFLQLFCSFDIFQTKILKENKNVPISKGYRFSYPDWPL